MTTEETGQRIGGFIGPNATSACGEPQSSCGKPCAVSSELRRRQRLAFTLVELLISISIIALLAALMLPALSSAKGKSLKAVCLNNLRQIGVGMSTYAADSGDYMIPAKRNKADDPEDGSFVQICLEEQTAKSCKTVGLEVSSSNHVSVWTCPDRPGLPQYEKITAEGDFETHQWILGYQYFGGITNWVNPAFPDGIASRSPVKLAQSKPTWCLAADAVIKAGRWGAVSTYHPGPPFENMPPHGGTRLAAPPGGNELFADSSARWIKFEQMYFLTTWKGALDSRQGFFYQDASDLERVVKMAISTLTLLYKRRRYYRWDGCKRIQSIVIQPV